MHVISENLVSPKPFAGQPAVQMAVAPRHQKMVDWVIQYDLSVTGSDSDGPTGVAHKGM